MGRWIARLIAAQDRWARPLGDFNQRWLKAIFQPIRPLKDVLSGVWLGHPLHAASTDIPIGTLLLSVVLDLLGQPAAADIALVATILFMLAAAASGTADYVDTDGAARVRATIHSTLMVVGLLVVIVSIIVRVGHPAVTMRNPMIERTIGMVRSAGCPMRTMSETITTSRPTTINVEWMVARTRAAPSVST